jgi:hypothetical protein
MVDVIATGRRQLMRRPGAVRDGMVAEGEQLETNLLQGKPA